jgi:hypothetical protein
MMRIAAGVCVAAALCLASAGAEAGDRSADERACTGDVYRLCREFIPRQTAIVACLKKKKRQLSPACRRVMSR